MDIEFALRFSNEWIAAWNAHDLERILSHYEDDFEMSSPVIKRMTEASSGKLYGKQDVGRYWAAALSHNPDLHFELQHVLIGVASVTVVYSGVRGMAAEVFYFNSDGKVVSAFAHYSL